MCHCVAVNLGFNELVAFDLFVARHGFTLNGILDAISVLVNKAYRVVRDLLVHISHGLAIRRLISIEITIALNRLLFTALLIRHTGSNLVAALVLIARKNRLIRAATRFRSRTRILRHIGERSSVVTLHIIVRKAGRTVALRSLIDITLKLVRRHGTLCRYAVMKFLAVICVLKVGHKRSTGIDLIDMPDFVSIYFGMVEHIPVKLNIVPLSCVRNRIAEANTLIIDKARNNLLCVRMNFIESTVRYSTLGTCLTRISGCRLCIDMLHMRLIDNNGL